MAPDCGAVRIGNCSGFYGDRLSAMREMLTVPPPRDIRSRPASTPRIPRMAGSHRQA